MRRLLILATVVAALVGVGDARADVVVAKDHQGRSMTFDVRAQSADVWWYAALLRNAAHGNEISRVTIRIIPWAEIAAACGDEDAAGCYGTSGGRGLMIVPAGRDASAAHTLLHEYGHHLDRWRGVRGVREPNGTANWWKARQMSSLLQRGRVARDYSLGWDRSIGEVFAEDYARLHLAFPYKIGWLSAPGPVIRAALRRDVPGIPGVSKPPPPLVIDRAGTLAPAQEEAVPFGLLGPGRRVTVTVALPDVAPEASARLTLSCGGREVVETVTAARATVTIDEQNLGPNRSCRAALVNTGGVPLSFTLRMRIAIEKRA